MFKRCACWGVGLLLAAGGAPASAQTTTPIPGQGTGLRPGPELRGQIVRVVPTRDIVVIRTGTGPTAREQEYRVSKVTQYFGPKNRALTDGLRYNGWTAGTNVWYQTAPGAGNMSLNYLRLSPAPVPGATVPGGTVPGGILPGGTVTPPPVTTPPPPPVPGGGR
jgi:hypothetical protein